MLAFVVFTLLTLNEIDIDDVRYAFHEVDSVAEIEQFINALQSDSSVEAQGYVAALTLLKSRFFTSPLKKLRYFNKGKKRLEELIRHHDHNAELRYLRFSIQISVPNFLGYYDAIDGDLSFLKDVLVSGSMSNDTKRLIVNNILDSGYLIDEDLLYFSKIKSEL